MFINKQILNGPHFSNFVTDLPDVVDVEAVQGNCGLPVQSGDCSDSGDRHNRDMELQAPHAGSSQTQERRLSGEK